MATRFGEMPSRCDRDGSPEIASLRKAQDKPSGVVRGSIVRHDELKVPIGLCQHALNGLLQVARDAVVSWDCDADCGHGRTAIINQ